MAWSKKYIQLQLVHSEHKHSRSKIILYVLGGLLNLRALWPSDDSLQELTTRSLKHL
jgi:hypothetical protein